MRFLLRAGRIWPGVWRYPLRGHCSGVMLRRCRRASRLAHLSLFWMILLALAAELFWFAQDLPWGMAAWGSGLMMAAGACSSFSFMRRFIVSYGHSEAGPHSTLLRR